VSLDLKLLLQSTLEIHLQANSLSYLDAPVT
jgi:hypothetical protein